jgi:hypothetical protein
MAHDRGFFLPVNVASPVDVARLLREITALIDFLDQSKIRQPGTPMKLPKTSRLLDEIVQANSLNLLQPEDALFLRTSLLGIKQKAPLLHISFSSDPSPLFLQRLMSYLRKEIHPFVLLQAGMQPTIGAGCMLRTKNKFFDFSLRQAFIQKRSLLTDQIRSLSAEDQGARVDAPVEQVVEAVTS